MLYVIITVLIIVLFYVVSNVSRTSNQDSVMSTKYRGLVTQILNWNKSSRVIEDGGFKLVIKAKVIMIDGDSTFTLFDKSTGELQITYLTTSSDSNYKSLNIVETYPQALCISNHDLVFQAFIEKIENAILNNTKRTAQDLVDRFYGTKPLSITEKYKIGHYYIATITRIYDELIMSTSNAEKSVSDSYILTEIKFLNGPLLGKDFFAKRISLDASCDLIVSQTVYAGMVAHINEDGTKTPSFYIFEKEELTTEEINKASLS